MYIFNFVTFKLYAVTNLEAAHVSTQHPTLSIPHLLRRRNGLRYNY